MKKKFSLSYAILLLASLHISSFSMHNMITFTDFPQEMNEKIFDGMSFPSQDRMRQTSHYWKQVGDSRTSFHNLLELLHSDLHVARETQSRALFAAVYRGDYDLAEVILKKTPVARRLCYPSLSDNDLYDPYSIVCGEDMISLLKKHRYDIALADGIEFPESNILRSLLITSIIGDNDSIATIINIELKNPHIRAELGEKRKAGKLKLPKDSRIMIKRAFQIAVHNDDNNSLAALIPFLSDSSAEDWWLEVLFEEACKHKKKKVLELLVQQKKNINEVENSSFGGDNRLVTFKNMILGINWSCAFDSNDQDYYKEIEALLNKYGAKTYEELQSQKN